MSSALGPLLQVLVVGHPGPERAGLESALRLLGHEVEASDLTDTRPPAMDNGHDAIVVDSRGPAPNWAALTDARRPLLVVADSPEGLPGPELATNFLVTDAERDDGYRIGLRLCVVLRAKS